MDYRSGNIGRVFWARVDEGEDLRQGLIELAEKENIEQAMVLLLGAMHEGSLVTGPKEAVIPPEPTWTPFTGGREVLGMASLIKGSNGWTCHLHLATGRYEEPALVGCLRGDSRIYLLVEAVVLEVTGFSARRKPDPTVGLELLAFD